MKNPIRLKSSRDMYEGNLVRVRADDVVLPRGTEATFEFVRIKPGVCVLPVDDDGNVYLIRRMEICSRATFDGNYLWWRRGRGGPFGRGRPRTSGRGRIRCLKWTELGVVDPFTSICYSPTELYLARDLTKIPREPEEAEVIELLRMSMDDAVACVMRGEVTHGASCTLILKAARILG